MKELRSKVDEAAERAIGMQTGDRTGKESFVEAALNEAEAIKKSYRPISLQLKQDSLLKKGADE